MENVSQLLHVATIAISLYQGWKLIKLFRENLDKRDKTKRMQVLSVKQFLSKADNDKRGYLVRLQPTECNTYNIKRDIHSNEYFYDKPPIKSVQNEFMNWLDNNKYKWFAKTNKQSSFFKKQMIAVNGVGEQISNKNLFKMVQKYQPDQRQSSSWKQFKLFIAFVIQIFVPYQLFSRPFIKGPVIGTINYSFGLEKGVSIVVKGNLINEQIVPEISAFTKTAIVNHFDQLTKFAIFQILLVSITLIIQRKILKKWLLGFGRLVKKLFNFLGFFKKNDQLVLAEIPQRISCIICLNQCRDVVFFDCKHLIMCQQCLQAYQKNVCPVCNERIQHIQIIKKV